MIESLFTNMALADISSAARNDSSTLASIFYFLFSDFEFQFLRLFLFKQSPQRINRIRRILRLLQRTSPCSGPAGAAKL